MNQSISSHGIYKISCNIVISTLWRSPWLIWCFAWWRYQLETLSALLVLCEGYPSIPLTKKQWRSFEVFFHDIQSRRLDKELNGRWFGTPWRSFDVTVMLAFILDGTELHHPVYTHVSKQTYWSRFVVNLEIWKDLAPFEVRIIGATTTIRTRTEP